MKKRIFAIVKYLIFLVLVFLLHLYNNHMITFVILLMTILFPVLSISAFYKSEKKLRASIEFSPNTVSRNQSLEMLLTLQNPTPYPFSRIEFSIRLQHNFLPNDYVHKYPFSLPPGKEVTCRVPVSFGICGCYQAESVSLECSDFGGFVSRKTTPYAHTELVIMPQLFSLQDEIQQLQVGEQQEDLVEATQTGQNPNEIQNIREYRQGDRLQTIHWKLSAKERQWMVKEFSTISGISFRLFVDYSFHNIRHLDPFFDLLYSLCDFLLEGRIPLEVCWLNSANSLLETAEITDREKIQIMLLKLFYEQPGSKHDAPLKSYFKNSADSANILVLTTRQYRDASYRLLMQHKGIVRIYQISQ